MRITRKDVIIQVLQLITSQIIICIQYLTQWLQGKTWEWGELLTHAHQAKQANEKMKVISNNGMP